MIEPHIGLAGILYTDNDEPSLTAYPWVFEYEWRMDYFRLLKWFEDIFDGKWEFTDDFDGKA